MQSSELLKKFNLTYYLLTNRSRTIFRVRLFTYCLFLILVCLLGIYTVNQKSLQTQARYKLAKVLEEEQRVSEMLLREKVELSELLSPDNLQNYNDKYELGMKPLQSVEDYKDVVEEN